MHEIGRHSENNIKCVVHDDLGRKNRTTRYNCGFSSASLALRVIFSVSQFFHGALQLFTAKPRYDLSVM